MCPHTLCIYSHWQDWLGTYGLVAWRHLSHLTGVSYHSTTYVEFQLISSLGIQLGSALQTRSHTHMFSVVSLCVILDGECLPLHQLVYTMFYEPTAPLTSCSARIWGNYIYPTALFGALLLPHSPSPTAMHPRKYTLIHNTATQHSVGEPVHS